MPHVCAAYTSVLGYTACCPRGVPHKILEVGVVTMDEHTGATEWETVFGFASDLEALPNVVEQITLGVIASSNKALTGLKVSHTKHIKEFSLGVGDDWKFFHPVITK